MNKASEAAFTEAAKIIGCGVPAIRAVFAVEASGKFFERDGSLPQRFEPHHFPKAHWQAIGFFPEKVKPWQASLAISTGKRAAMFETASKIDAAAAMRATSWGAPQIMGFNCKWAGFGTAAEMVAAFQRSADEQVIAFARFVVSQGLDRHVRAQDWLPFATGYNGAGQAKVYAAKIEAAYKRESGGKRSSVVLRKNARGESVYALQTRLVEIGFLEIADGAFGPATEEAVKKFQADAGIPIDGVVGARTWEALRAYVPIAVAEPAVQPDAAEINLTGALSAVAAGGGGSVVGTFLSDLGPVAQTILIGGFVVAGAVVLALWAIPRFRRALA